MRINPDKVKKRLIKLIHSKGKNAAINNAKSGHITMKLHLTRLKNNWPVCPGVCTTNFP